MDRFRSRRDKLRKLLHQSDADSMLVTNYTNVTYLTGFSGDDSYLLVCRDGEVLLSDPRYTTQLEQECPGLELAIRPPGVGMLETIEREVKKARPQRLAVEAGSMTVRLHAQIAEKLAKTELASETTWSNSWRSPRISRRSS